MKSAGCREQKRGSMEGGKKKKEWSESLRLCFCIKQGPFNVRDIDDLVSMDARFP